MHAIRTTRRAGVLTAAVVGLGLLAACGGGAGGGAAAVGGTTTTAAAVVAGPAPSSDSPAPTAASAEPTDVVDLGETASCLVGRWQVGAEQISRVFDNSPVHSLPGFSIAADGVGFIELRVDGTYTYTPNFTITITHNGTSGIGTLSGALDGTWSVSGDQLTMAQTANNLAGSLSVMGTTVPMTTVREPLDWWKLPKLFKKQRMKDTVRNVLF